MAQDEFQRIDFAKEVTDFRRDVLDLLPTILQLDDAACDLSSKLGYRDTTGNNAESFRHSGGLMLCCRQQNNIPIKWQREVGTLLRWSSVKIRLKELRQNSKQHSPNCLAESLRLGFSDMQAGFRHQPNACKLQLVLHQSKSPQKRTTPTLDMVRGT